MCLFIPYDLKLVEKDIPVPKEEQVLVKMLTAGICGTDLAIYNWSEHIANLVTPPVCQTFGSYRYTEDIYLILGTLRPGL